MSAFAMWLSQWMSARTARFVAWLIAIAIVLALLAIGKCTYDANLIDNHEAKVAGKTLGTDAAAKDEAAEQRVTDIITIDQAERERNDAINSEPAERPNAARIRLNCERLRQAGYATADFAECR